MREIILIAHNLRSCHNVGSLLRTAEGLGIHKVWLTGYTPYPLQERDSRLPHIANKLHKQIRKTALGAEESQNWGYCEDIAPILAELKNAGFVVGAIEQADTSIALPDFTPPEKIALIVGREVEGIEPAILATCDIVLEIPMFGKKESYNVVQAAAMGMFHMRFR